MGMGIGMGAAGNFMGTASETNRAQMQQQAAQAQQNQTPAADTWKCACGAENTGKFCPSCGAKKPENTTWKCACGAENTGKFCPNCGAARPAAWTCPECGTENKGKFCSNCGHKYDG